MTLSIAVRTGGPPVYLPAGGARTTPYATLKGRPAFPVEYCATLGTTGDIMLIDFSQMAAIEKDAMQADQSIHVRFNTNENTFRFIYRFDAQPTWNSALTPYKGSATKSFAIKLDTRA
jgi:HK97 family phage major capsid protein